MESVETIFTELGGTSDVARRLNVGQSTASEMRRRGSIPVQYWPDLVALAADQGKPLSYDKLVEIHARKRVSNA